MIRKRMCMTIAFRIFVWIIIFWNHIKHKGTMQFWIETSILAHLMTPLVIYFLNRMKLGWYKFEPTIISFWIQVSNNFWKEEKASASTFHPKEIPTSVMQSWIQGRKKRRKYIHFPFRLFLNSYIHVYFLNCNITTTIVRCLLPVISETPYQWTNYRCSTP